MNDSVERFRNDAYSLYFDVLNRYRISVRRATSRLDRENEYQNSREELMRSLEDMKKTILRQYTEKETYSSIQNALDVESRSYLQRFDKEVLQ